MYEEYKNGSVVVHVWSQYVLFFLYENVSTSQSASVASGVYESLAAFSLALH